MKEIPVLFLTNTYPDDDSSYRGIFIKKMATLLSGEGYQVSVVTPKIYKASKHFEERDGIKVYRFSFGAGNRLLIQHEGIPYFKMALYYISGFFVSLYVLLRSKCELIHVHWAIPTGLIAAWLSIIMRKPFIVTVHGSDFRMAMENNSLLYRVFCFVCRKATHISCVSHLIREELERKGISPGKISVFPMGVEDNFLESSKARGENGLKRPYLILSNRNLLPMYNVSWLIRAIPLVVGEEPNIKFLIAGDGPQRQDLEEQARKLEVNGCVRFLGRVPHDEMPGLLAQADIFVSTSSCDGASVSLLEAMGSGAFPIVADIAANREWINDGKNGFLVPIGETETLAKRIVQAIHNRELVETGRKENRDIVRQKALWLANIEKVKEIYSRMSPRVA